MSRWGLPVSCLLSCLFLAGPIVDFDVWWHLASGRDILANLSIPRIENFSHTLSGAPWVDFEWLFQAAAYGLWCAGGLAALVALKAAAVTSALALTFFNVRRSGGDTGTALGSFWTVFTLLRTRALERPELFTLPFLAFLLGLLLEARRRRSARPLWWAVPLLAVWANLHGGFVLGLGLLFFSGLGLFLEDRAAGRGSGLWKATALPAACAAAGTLLNPYGFSIYGIPFWHLAKSREAGSLIDEWRTLGFEHYPVFWILLGASLGWLLWDLFRGRREALFWAPILTVFGYWSSGQVRSPAIFSLLAAPYLFGRWGTSGRFSPWAGRAAALGVAAGALLSSPGLRIPSFDRSVDWHRLPRAAAEFVEESGLKGRMYNTYEWGGYLEWRFGRSRPVFFDGRYLFFGLLQEETEARETPEAFATWLNRYGIDYAIVKHAARPVTRSREGRVLEIPRSPWPLIFPRREWALLFWDDAAIVFVRRGGPNGSVIDERGEWGAPDPDDVDLWAEGVRRGFLRKEDLLAELERHGRETGYTRTAEILRARIEGFSAVDGRLQRE